MTTYTLSGYQVRYSLNDDIESIAPAQVDLVVSQGEDPTFAYAILEVVSGRPARC